jgi:adenylate cyclase
MSAVVLDAIRGCFEDYVPAVLATCGPDGTPNVSLISQVHYVGPDQVALSYQFFNKTRRNLLATRKATISVIDPATAADFRLDLDYQETQTQGPVFESMRAKLAGIASHTGMAGVFQLRGADIMRVRSITEVPGPRTAASPASRSLLAAVRRSWQAMTVPQELGHLFDCTLENLQVEFGMPHAMLLMLDEGADRLYTVASMGYASSGVGSELAVGHGIIGVAARERVPIRIGHMSADYSYGAAVRNQALEHGLAEASATEIPYPGLAAPESQIAVPVLLGQRLLGVLFAESPAPMRFCYEEEDALVLIADRLAELIATVQRDEATVAGSSERGTQEAGTGPAVITVRHYAADDSIFLGHDYLIKGVAGAIFWKLVRAYVEERREEFTNRELRLDPTLRLPEHAENLEARLVLLQRRLSERSPLRIEKQGRGRFRLVVPCGLSLAEVVNRNGS